MRFPFDPGRVMLNPDVCWVDARAFETLATNLLKKPRDALTGLPPRLSGTFGEQETCTEGHFCLTRRRYGPGQCDNAWSANSRR